MIYQGAFGPAFLRLCPETTGQIALQRTQKSGPPKHRQCGAVGVVSERHAGSFAHICECKTSQRCNAVPKHVHRTALKDVLIV